MKAKVIKTGEVVTLTDKQGDYYLDTNNNPYREQELEFGVLDTEPTSQDPLMSTFGRMFDNKHQLMLPALVFASEVIKAKPHMCSGDLCEYVIEVITAIKKAL